MLLVRAPTKRGQLPKLEVLTKEPRNLKKHPNLNALFYSKLPKQTGKDKRKLMIGREAKNQSKYN